MKRNNAGQETRLDTELLLIPQRLDRVDMDEVQEPTDETRLLLGLGQKVAAAPKDGASL